MFAVDTNVLILAANRDSEYRATCLALIEQWRNQSAPWFLTWSICYEFLRVVTHRRTFPRPLSVAEARSFLDPILDTPGLSMLVATNNHAAVLRQTLNEVPTLRGNDLHDLHIAVLMREHGISRIVTRDLGFHRFPFLDVIDPLR